ncbi:MAG: family 16 glycosylhydrolase [Planctomycetota bacterium]
MPLRSLTLVLSLAFGAVSGLSQGGPVIVPGWGAPVFRDEFDGSSINTGVWEVGNWPNAANNEEQYYHPDQVLVYDGGLHLWAERDDNWTYGRNYNSGLVRTWQGWRYGRFEARAKIPWGQGFWPAIWMLPRGPAWPVGGEIDIMENVGNNTRFVKGSYHYNWEPGWPITSNADYITGEDFAAGYHDYAVEWEADQMRFYVDGNLYHVIDNPIQPDPAPMSITLNLAVGGDWPGSPSWSTPFPSSFDIDYVRVWQRPELTAPPTSLIVDPGFEAADGGMEDWGRFGNSIDNVTSDYGTPRDGERSLKLYGQFNDEDNISGAYQSLAVSPGAGIVAGAHALIRSDDSILGTENEALMKLEFYSEAGAARESEAFLSESIVSLSDGIVDEDSWTYFQIEDTAPYGTVEARIAFVFLQPETSDSGSVFIDSVTFEATLEGDFNLDGVVDVADYTVWRDTVGTQVEPGTGADANENGIVDLQDYAWWREAMHGPAPEPLAIPEPTSATGWLAATALGCFVRGSRRGRRQR